jgi:arginine decarboxylase
VICNGFKRDQYIENIARLINTGHKNTIPIIDNFEELDLLQGQIKNKFKIEFVSPLKKSQSLNFIPPD